MYDNAGLLVTAKLIAVSSAVVQMHTPWKRKARACGVWNIRTAGYKISGRNAAIRAFAPLNESCEMTAAFSAGCNTKHFNFTTRLCMMIHPDTSI